MISDSGSGNQCYCAAKNMNTVKKYCMPTIILVLLLLISCGPQLSKEEKRRINELKHYVLDNPVNINSPHDRYGIPIHYAVLNNYPFLMHHASLVGNVEMTGFLLKEGADPDLAIPNGQSPIHTAASMGHAELVKVLIEGGANVNQRDNEGMTPLKRALHFPAIHYEAGKREPIDTSAVVKILQDHGGIE